MKLHFQSDLSQIKVLVITGQEMADSVLERLKENLDISYRIVGVACPEYEEGVTGQIRGVPIVGMGQHFMEELTQMALDEVFLYAPELRQKQIQEILNGLDEMGVDSHYCLELPGTHSSTGTIDDFGSYFVLTYTRFKSSYKRLLLKRLMDIAGGLVGLLITLLFFPFVAIAIKLDSPGPVLFPRCGSEETEDDLRSISSAPCMWMQSRGKKTLKNKMKCRDLCLRWRMIPALPEWGGLSGKPVLTNCRSFIMF